MSVLKNKVLNAIPRTEDQEVRVWDMFMESWDEDHSGRVRIVALIPKQPHPLINIPFAIAWCNPEDARQYSKAQANMIAAGRLTKYMETMKNTPEGHIFQTPKNVGTIPSLDTLKNFHEQCFLNVLEIPRWVFPAQFDSEELSKRLFDQAIKYRALPTWAQPLKELLVKQNPGGHIK